MGELIRFVMTGGIATVANMLVVWTVRRFVPAGPSLAFGLVAGMVASFLLMKLFAFRAKDWSGGWGEVARFLLVYAMGTVAYLGVALITERVLSGMAVAPRWAALGGVLTGGTVMAVTSYFGHRHYTYRMTIDGEAKRG